jgi:hypothetical protein
VVGEESAWGRTWLVARRRGLAEEEPNDLYLVG